MNNEQKLKYAYAKTVVKYKEDIRLYPYTTCGLPSYFFRAGATFEQDRNQNLIHSVKTAIEYLKLNGCEKLEDGEPEKAMMKDLDKSLKEYEGVK